MESLIGPDSPWLLWTALATIATLGLLAETTAIGLKVSAAVVSLLLGLGLSNLGVIPAQAPVYEYVLSYGVPLAIPLLLFQADLNRVLRESGRVLIAFSIGAAGTVAGSVIGFWLLPLGDSAAALTGAIGAAYIGGTLNFVATAGATGLEPGLTAAGIAAANLVVVLYLVVLFLLSSAAAASRWFGAATRDLGRAEPRPEAVGKPATALDIANCILISSLVCTLGFAVERAVGWPGTAIVVITAVSVAAATAYPAFFRRLTVAETLGTLVLQMFFATIGASASVYAIVDFGPVLILFAATVLLLHFVCVFVGGRIAGLRLDEVLIGSNACAAGAFTAAAMAASLRRRALVVPAILCGTLGYALGTFAGIVMANAL